MAPEVALDAQGSYDGQMADVWACGVILYTLAAGRYPFGDESQEQPALVYQRVVSGQFAELPRGQVSQECVDLIRRILVPDPAQRATIAEIKAHAWFTGTVFPDPPLPGSIGSIMSVGSDGLPEFQWPSYDDFTSAYVLGGSTGEAAAGGALPDPATLGADVQSDLFDPLMGGDTGGHSSGGSGSGGAGSVISSNDSGHEEMMMAPPPRVGDPPPGGWSQGSGLIGPPLTKWPSWTGGLASSGGGSSGELRELPAGGVWCAVFIRASVCICVSPSHSVCLCVTPQARRCHLCEAVCVVTLVTEVSVASAAALVLYGTSPFILIHSHSMTIGWSVVAERTGEIWTSCARTHSDRLQSMPAPTLPECFSQFSLFSLLNLQSSWRFKRDKRLNCEMLPRPTSPSLCVCGR